MEYVLVLFDERIKKFAFFEQREFLRMIDRVETVGIQVDGVAGFAAPRQLVLKRGQNGVVETLGIGCA